MCNPSPLGSGGRDSCSGDGFFGSDHGRSESLDLEKQAQSGLLSSSPGPDLY